MEGMNNKPKLLPDFRAYIYLDVSEVDFSGIEEKAIKEGYRKQTEGHITVIGNTYAKIIRDALPSQKSSEEVLVTLQNLTDEFSWQFKPSKIYHIRKEGRFGSEDAPLEQRESYIMAINMPDMAKFYAGINELFNIQLSSHFPHITLFTKGESANPHYYGIGIRSIEEFNKLDPKEIKCKTN